MSKKRSGKLDWILTTAEFNQLWNSSPPTMWRMQDSRGVQYIHVQQSIQTFDLNDNIKQGVSAWPQDGTTLFWCKAPPLKKPFVDKSHKEEKPTRHYDPEMYYTPEESVPLPSGDLGILQQLSTDMNYYSRYSAMVINTQRRTPTIKCRTGLVSLQLTPYVL